MLALVTPDARIVAVDDNKDYARLFVDEKRYEVPSAISVASTSITFLPVKIGASHGLSLADLLVRINYTTIDFFKVDVDGTEFELIPEFTKSGQPSISACHVLIEVHQSAKGSMNDISRLLLRAGYYLYSAEINPGTVRGEYAIEYSLLHRSCFDQYGVTDNDVRFEYV